MSFSRPSKTKDQDAEHALASALRLLARREYSQKELLVHLKRRYTDEAADTALKTCIAHNYQSDRRYADMLLRHLLSNSWGPARFFYDAAVKGVAESLAKEFAEDADWEGAALQYLKKKWRSSQRPDQEGEWKLLSALARRGFDASCCSEALEQFYRELDLKTTP